MQSLLRMLFFITLSLTIISTFAQGTEPPSTDEEFNVFLMVLALLGFSVMTGLAVITILLAALVLFCIASMIGAGVLSASVGVGIYKKSLVAAVRMAFILILLLICAIGGATIGWLLDKMFDFSMSSGSVALVGAGAGALGGVLGAMAIFWMIKKVWGKLQKAG